MKKAMLPSLKIDSWTEEALSDLTAKISDNKVKSLILIDGAAGSGKTTLAVKLAERLHANLVHTDDVSSVSYTHLFIITVKAVAFVNFKFWLFVSLKEFYFLERSMFLM